MSETQKTIHEWATRTFGPSTPLDRLVRCNVEAGELLSAIHNMAPLHVIAGEIGDVQIIFMQVKEGLSYDSPSSNYDPFPADATELAAELCVGIGHLLQALAKGLTLGDVWDVVHDIQEILILLAHTIGVDLDECVDAKMKINRARTWRKLESGRFQHA